MRQSRSLRQTLTDLYRGAADARERFWQQMGRRWPQTPATLGMDFEELSLRTADGVQLAAWFVPGRREGSAARANAELTVVAHHHYGGQRATLLPWIDLFHRAGADVLAIDARGHGQSAADGNPKDCFVRRAADVHAACDEIRARGGRHIVGFGQSQGAAALAMAAAARRDVVGVIFDSGPAPLMEVAGWGLSRAMLEVAQYSVSLAARLMLSVRMLGQTRPLRYNVTLWPSLMRLRDRQLLWIHGDADVVIARHWPHLWFRALAPGDGRWRALTVPGGRHVRTIKPGGEDLQHEVAEFLARCGATVGA